jgi:hypothetical protein
MWRTKKLEEDIKLDHMEIVLRAGGGVKYHKVVCG